MDGALALVRHGQTDWNLEGRLQGQTDIPLNRTGHDQARAVGRQLAGQGWDLVLASPLGRAQQTAEIIARQIDARLGPALHELVERSFGPLEGHRRAELDQELVQRLLERAEPREWVLHRAVLGLYRVLGEHPGQRILCVSHGATMRIVRDTLLGQKLPQGVENGELVPVDLLRLKALRNRLLSGEPAIP